MINAEAIAQKLGQFGRPLPVIPECSKDGQMGDEGDECLQRPRPSARSGLEDAAALVSADKPSILVGGGVAVVEGHPELPELPKHIGAHGMPKYRFS